MHFKLKNDPEKCQTGRSAVHIGTDIDRMWGVQDLHPVGQTDSGDVFDGLVAVDFESDGDEEYYGHGQVEDEAKFV